MDAALDYCKELYDLCDEYGVAVIEQDSEEYYVSLNEPTVFVSSEISYHITVAN